MDITKIGIIGLTLASFVLVPSMPSLDADSSELASWHSEVYENLDGIRQDYNFRKYSPDLNAMIDGIVQTYNGALSGVISFYESASNFLQNPAVLIFGEEDFSDDALELGYIPDGRMTQLLWQSTFLSNQQVVDQLLSPEEITYILSVPLIQDWPWLQGYFFHIRNTIWPISDLSIFEYCELVE
jgi:hypothetical protein